MALSILFGIYKMKSSLRPVIFVHGFGSGKGSSKYVALKNQLDPTKFIVDIIESDYSTATYNEIEAKFKLMLEKYADYPEPIVVGHSLGGYWTRVFSNVFLYSSVIVNPSLLPHETLNTKIPIVQYKPVPHSIIDHTSRSSCERVYIELGDEVVDQQAQIDKGLFICSNITTVPDGHHRIQYVDNVIDEVIKMHERLNMLESYILTD